MTVYFVSRHEGAARWARILQAKRKDLWPHPVDVYVEHLDYQALKRGDIVIGTLPVKGAAAVRERGAEFYSLDLDVPPQLRGQELSATQMAACGATLTHYRIAARERIDLPAVASRLPKARARAKPSPATTIMLVSQELVPQFLGFVHNPTPRVILAVTPGMQQRAQDLRQLLRGTGHGLKDKDIISFPLSDGQGYKALLQQAEELLEALALDRTERVVINLTGGTKLMSMAFGDAGQAAIRALEPVELAYVNTQNRCIEHIHGRNSDAQPMRPALGVREAVLASGKPDAGCASASEVFQRQMQRRSLHEALLAARIGALNRLCMEAAALLPGGKASGAGSPALVDGAKSKPKEGLFALRRFAPRERGDGSLQESLSGKLGRLMHEHGVLAERPAVHGDLLYLRFTHRSELDYLNGGWLEAHLASIVAQAGPDDWACGVQVGAEKGRNNEIDLIVTCGNRTLLIEAKTANLSRREANREGESASQAQNAIYKLDSIGHDLARNFNNNWLVSTSKLDDTDIERARDKRIELFAPTDAQPSPGWAIRQFTQRLTDWIRESRIDSPADQAFEPHPLRISSDWKKVSNLKWTGQR